MPRPRPRPPCPVRIVVQPLGAAREVGRSCLLLRFVATVAAEDGDVEVDVARGLLDVGLSHTKHDARERYPDLTQLQPPSGSKGGGAKASKHHRDAATTTKDDDDQHLDFCLLTHVHSDHVGALPILTEKRKSNVMVLAAGPTKLVLGKYLKELWKAPAGKSGALSMSQEEINASVERVRVVEPRQTVEVPTASGVKVSITGFKAGHVQGAMMFLIRVGENGDEAAVLYTGDYNATPDRGMTGAFDADIPMPPSGIDVVISECTYGSTIRGSERAEQRVFVNAVHRALMRGGRVLIPTNASGRVLDMVDLVETHLRARGLASRVPVRVVLADAPILQRMCDRFAGWSEPAHSSAAKRTRLADELAADATPVSDWRRLETEGTGGINEEDNLLRTPGALVLFAQGLNLSGGLSLRAFRAWCGDERCAVVFPAACFPGSNGAAVLDALGLDPPAGVAPTEARSKWAKLAMGGSGAPVTLENSEKLVVRCEVTVTRLAQHTDAQGIVQMVRQCRPRHVVLVHGEEDSIAAMKIRLQREFPRWGAAPPPWVHAPRLNDVMTFPLVGSASKLKASQSAPTTFEVDFTDVRVVDVPREKLPQITLEADPTQVDWTKAIALLDAKTAKRVVGLFVPRRATDVENDFVDVTNVAGGDDAWDVAPWVADSRLVAADKVQQRGSSGALQPTKDAPLLKGVVRAGGTTVELTVVWRSLTHRIVAGELLAVGVQALARLSSSSSDA